MMFLRLRIGLILLSALLLIAKSTQAQEEDYVEKFQLIHALKKYLVDSTAYNLDTSKFYSNYTQIEEGHNYYVYVSEKEKPVAAKGYDNFKYFGNDSVAAQTFVNGLNNKLVSYYLYKTAGTSAAKLNAALLSYFNEEIAFIVFHEATHLYINSFNDRLPYVYVEALCDASALSLLNRFAKDYPLFFNQEAVVNFTTAVTSIHSLVTAGLLTIKDKPAKADKVLNSVQSQITNFLTYSSFLRQRYSGNVNMAWMMKNKNYSGAYFYCKMFVGFPNTKIMTQTLSKVFGTDKNDHLNEMVQKDLYLYLEN